MSEDKKAEPTECVVETKIGEGTTYVVGQMDSLKQARDLMREFDTQSPTTSSIAVCTQPVKQKPPGPS